MNRVNLQFLFLAVLSSIVFQSCSVEDKEYHDFYNRLLSEEPYIGFFAAEKKCITEITDEYLIERKKYFLGISTCKEEIEEFNEPFMEFLTKNELINEGCEEEWEKVLTILGFELYVNMPIFEFTTDKAIEHRSIVFAEYPNKKLELDLFLPKDPIDEPIPVVVCIHGGGWVVNRRVWFEPFAKYLASKGMAAVTIDYRMLPAVTVMECAYDSKAAVRWVRANAAEYGIDPNRIGAIGASAGAQLVALLGTSADVSELEGTGGNEGVSSEVQAVVGIATPSFKLDDSAEFAKRFGISPEEMKLLSPYENADANSAPMFLIHGDADKTVAPQNSQELYDKFKNLGVHIELKWIPGEDHGFYEGTDIAIKMASDFFIKQFMN